MVFPTYNTTGTFDAPTFAPFAPFALLRTFCTTVLSKLPFNFSYVQQVHVKLKAETAVMFAFYFAKQVYAYGKSWRAKREGERLRQVRDAARKEKKKRKQRGRYKKQKWNKVKQSDIISDCNIVAVQVCRASKLEHHIYCSDSFSVRFFSSCTLSIVLSCHIG